jgi:hypothetical protein
LVKAVKTHNQRKEQNRLRNFLNRQVKELSDEAIQSNGQVSETKLAALERLERLLKITTSATPATPVVRWPLIGLLGLTLFVVTVLLFARVRTTEIELDLLLSEVSFRIPQQQVLYNEIALSSLAASGLDEIQLPRSQAREARRLQKGQGEGGAIRLTAQSDSQNVGVITLGTLIVPAETKMSLRPTGIPQQYQISFKSAGLNFPVSVTGPIEIGLPSAPAEVLTFSSPKSVTLKSGRDPVDLNLTLLKEAKNTFSRQVVIDSLALFGLDQYLNLHQTILRRVSTIASGTLYFQSLGGKEHRLRAGEAISFKASKGEIRTLELKGDQISFSFHGRVSGMTTGGEENRVSLMPTYLEWLKARHGLSLLWGTTLYFFGLILSIIRWWRTSS